MTGESFGAIGSAGPPPVRKERGVTCAVFEPALPARGVGSDDVIWL